MVTINKKGAAFGGALLAVFTLLIASHFIIAQDELARQYTISQYQQTTCGVGGTCATGSVLDPTTARAPSGVTELDPVSSFDNIIDQTADATQSPIFPGGSERIELIGLITKVDSFGNRITQTVTIEVPTLSVVLDPSTGFDISTGLIEAELIVKTENELAQVNTIGSFSYELNGNTVETYSLSDIGRTNNKGERTITQTQPLIFSFAKHIGTFTEDGLSTITFKINDITIEKDGVKFGISDSEFYTAQFFKSDVITKITNEEGGEDIIFPVDDQIKICAQNSFVTFDGEVIPDVVPNAIPHPPMGKVTLLSPDGTSEVIFQAVGEGSCSSATECSSSCTFTNISRNSIYELEFTDPIAVTSFKTPFSQKNYYFSCYFTDETKQARNCSLEP
jgi:hypothetical protein